MQIEASLIFQCTHLEEFILPLGIRLSDYYISRQRDPHMWAGGWGVESENISLSLLCTCYFVFEIEITNALRTLHTEIELNLVH